MPERQLNMTSDTLRQKYVYNVPFDDDEYPLVKFDKELVNKANLFTIKASDLWFIEQEDFNKLCKVVKGHYDGIVIKYDYEHKSHNQTLYKGNKCYLLSFVYHFKKSGIKCTIDSFASPV